MRVLLAANVVVKFPRIWNRVFDPEKDKFPLPKFPAWLNQTLPSSIDTSPVRLFMSNVFEVKFNVPSPVFLNPCDPIISVKMAKRPVLTDKIGAPLVELRVRLPANVVELPKRKMPAPFVVIEPAIAVPFPSVGVAIS